jgi:Flp pilus assembly protein CpaB
MGTPTFTPPSSKGSNNGHNSSSMLATRRGSMTVAVVTAVLAAAILLVFMSRYRADVSHESKTETVLVARNMLPRGSSGQVIASQGLFQAVQMKRGDVKDGALTDPAALKGKVTTVDVFSGQQITARDLTAAQDPVLGQITGNQRAVAVSVDGQHGLIGSLHPGDHVDVYGAFNGKTGGSTGPSVAVLKEIIQNVLVLRAPATAGTGLAGSGQQPVVLRAPDTVAARIAFAAENGTVWLTLRPQAGAQQSPPSLTTIESVLFGKPAVNIQSTLIKKGIAQAQKIAGAGQ